MSGKKAAAICTGMILAAGILTACGRNTVPETIVPKETEVQTSVVQKETEERMTESKSTEKINTEETNVKETDTKETDLQETETEIADEEIAETVILEAYIQEIDGKILILADKDGGLYQMDTEGVDIRIPEEMRAESGTETGTEANTESGTENDTETDTEASTESGAGDSSDMTNEDIIQKLHPGMAVDIVYSGILMRNIPATLPQVESVTVVSDREDPYGFYRTVLQTIWDTKPELNEGIEFVALDLSDADNISENQKYVLEYVMRNIAQCEVRLASDDQLEQEGILNDEGDSFAEIKGMLISIDDERRRENKILFDAEKRISDTAEAEWDDQTARYENGKWELTGQ